MDRYRSIVEKLIEDDRCFPCTCSRNDIANAQSAPHESSEATAPTKQIDGQVYPGTCRKKQLAREQLPEKHAWRWKFEPGSITWTDALSGRQELEPSVMLGDFVIAKSNLAPSYQLAVVIDDHDMGVTEIIRGDDLIYSTFRQLSIQRHLSWQPPRYCHVPLIVGEDGRRLAKRHGDTRLSYFRDSGIRSQAIVGYLAWTLGMLDQLEPCSPRDLIPLLNWQQIPRKPTVFSLQRDRAFLQAIS